MSWYIVDEVPGAEIGNRAIVEADGTTVCDPSPMGSANARLIAQAPAMLDLLIRAVEASGFSLSGPTDIRAAEDGEPAWVCDARFVIGEVSHKENSHVEG